MGFFDVTSGPSIGFPTIGTRAGGTIAGEYTEVQSTEYLSDKLKLDKKGAPVMMACVPIQTTDRDPSIPQDDGIRTLYVDKPGMKIAIGEAIKASGAPDLEVGATLFVTWTGETPSTKGSPLKTWSAEYARPVGSLGVQPAPTPAVTAPPAAVAAPAAPAAPATNVDALAKIKKLQSAGFDIATIHELVPQFSLDMIQAVLNV